MRFALTDEQKSLQEQAAALPAASFLPLPARSRPAMSR